MISKLVGTSSSMYTLCRNAQRYGTLAEMLVVLAPEHSLFYY